MLMALGAGTLVGMFIFVFIRGRKRGQKKPTVDYSRKFSVIEDVGGKAFLDESIHSEATPGPSWTTLGLEQPLVIAMVGLPARGKSYIVKMMIRYLSWTGLEAQVFNVGAYRRAQGLAGADSNFFSNTNDYAKQVREDMAMKVQDMMYSWLHEKKGAQRVAVFDATNTTKTRRQAILNRGRCENTFILFVESICNDDEVLNRNYELKLRNEDYIAMDPVKARADFIDRVRAYEKQYETIEDNEDNYDISYIKLVDVGQKVISRNCYGYLPSQVAFFLQNVHINPRKIYLSLNAIGNDGHVNDSNPLEAPDDMQLSIEGREYSLNLAKFMTMVADSSSSKRRKKLRDPKDSDLLVLAGTSRADDETILHLRMVCPCFNTPLLNELRAGDLHGMSPEQIKRDFPLEYQKRNEDKLRYRYPGVGGESYLDVIERIRPVIIELERQRRSVLVVSHLAVIRCIYAYFSGSKPEEIPHLPIKMHEVIELEPGPFGCRLRVVDPSTEVVHM